MINARFALIAAAAASANRKAREPASVPKPRTALLRALKCSGACLRTL